MTQPLELSLAALSPPPLVLSISEDLSVTIPAPGIRMVAELFALEEAIGEAAKKADAEPDAFLQAQMRAADYLVALFKRHEPRVPDDLDLNLRTVLALISSIVQGPTAALAIQNALVGEGLLSDEARKAARERQDEADKEAGTRGGKKSSGPLAPKKRSSKRSSRSGSGTTGGQNGGSTPAAPGRRSGSTSRTRSAG